MTSVIYKPTLSALGFFILGSYWCASPTVAAGKVSSSFNPPTTSVQMFHWSWNDLAKECTAAIGPIGYGAIQISPPQASKITGNWHDMYQPVNFKSLTSRMGTEADLKNMIKSCHDAGVRVYADIVSNQMAANSSATYKSTDGSTWNSATLAYPQFSKYDFHEDCDINPSVDYDKNRSRVISCRLEGMPDLDTSSSYVQGEISNYMKKLLSLGIDGFRMDAAKHQGPESLGAIIKAVKATYPTTLAGEEIWITQEVIPDGTVTRMAYADNGTINEFSYTRILKEAFRSENGNNLESIPRLMGTPGKWFGEWQVLPSEKATVFVNNWDTERNPDDSLNASNNNFNDRYYSKRYDLANIFMLAWPYGEAQVHSGFKFNGKYDDAPKSSPYKSDGQPDTSEWDFIHRWTGIARMVKFRSAADVTGVKNWVTGSVNQIAFSRGSMGFVALNNDTSTWKKAFKTGLPAGKYCNIIKSSSLTGKVSCPGKEITVDQYGNATLTIPPNDGVELPAVVIYSGSKI